MTKDTSKIEAFPEVEAWRKSLDRASFSRSKKELSKTVWRKRLRRLMQFCEFTGKTPTQLLAEASESVETAMDRLISYHRWLQEQGLTSNSARTLMAYIRGFYSHNDVAFPKSFSVPRAEPAKVNHQDDKADVWDIDEAGAITLNNLVPQFISNLSFRDKTIALCLMSSGQDTADLLALNIEFVHDAKGELADVERFYWMGVREKDRRGRTQDRMTQSL
ncbi:MAG: hypothetical protein ACXABY_36850 [Candidatus Thorarchaeota archaeon]|jgi:site-specific recombinase XerD